MHHAIDNGINESHVNSHTKSLSESKENEWVQMGTRPPKEGAAQPLTTARLASHCFLFTECHEIQQTHTAPFHPHGYSQSWVCNCNAYCMHRQESGLHLSENGTRSPREGMEHTVHRLWASPRDKHSRHRYPESLESPYCLLNLRGQPVFPQQGGSSFTGTWVTWVTS